MPISPLRRWQRALNARRHPSEPPIGSGETTALAGEVCATDPQESNLAFSKSSSRKFHRGSPSTGQCSSLHHLYSLRESIHGTLHNPSSLAGP